MRTWWLPAAVLVAVGVAALTALGKLPGVPGWSATGVATIAAAALSQSVQARLRWRIERAPAAASALRNGFRLTPRGRVPRVGDIDPLALGVHPGTDGRLPPYVERDLDRELDELLSGGGLVVIEGQSAAGKTRTAAEAMRRALGGRALLVPQTGAALRSLVESGKRIGNAVIWLDDLQWFLVPGGVDAQLVRRICAPDRSDVVLLATIRSEARLDMVSTTSAMAGLLTRQMAEVMAMATTRVLDRALSPAELRRAQERSDDIGIADALSHMDKGGFTENLCAGPAILGRWRSGQRADGAALIGSAMVSAAVDCHRAGYGSPLPLAVLTRLYPHYLDSRDANRPGVPDLAAALAWATERVRGASSCLVPCGDDRYRAFDYLIDPPDRDPGDESIPEPVWDALLAHLEPRELAAVGAAAFVRRKWRVSRRFFVRWAESSQDPVIWYLAGNIVLQGGQADEWDQRATEAEPLLVRAADAGHPEAAGQLALLLGAKGDVEGRERWARFGAQAGDGDATVILGEILQMRNEDREAEKWYRRVIERGPVEAKRVPIEKDGHIETELPPMSFSTYELCGEYLEWQSPALRAMTHIAGVLAARGELDEAEYWLREGARYGLWPHLLALGAFLAERKGRKGLTEWCDLAAEAGRLDVVLELAKQAVVVWGSRLDSQCLFSYAADAGRAEASIHLGDLAKAVGDHGEAERRYREAEHEHPEQVERRLADLRERPSGRRATRHSIGQPERE